MHLEEDTTHRYRCEAQRRRLPEARTALDQLKHKNVSLLRGQDAVSSDGSKTDCQIDLQLWKCL